MTDMVELIAKLEAASVGNEDLDCEIGDTLDPITAARGDTRRIISYTTSLDAARAMLPKGKDWDVAWITSDSPKCRWQPKFAEATVYGKDFWQRESESWKFVCVAATPELALCIAALKARAALSPHPTTESDTEAEG